MMIEMSQARQILESLRQGFIAHIPQRLAAIEQSWIDCHMAAKPVPALHELMRLAHSLHGSAKTFGLMELGDAAGTLENELSSWVENGQVPGQDARSRLDELVAALHATSREVVDTHAETALNPVRVIKGRVPLVYLLEDDPDQSTLLSSQLEYFGYRAIAFATPANLSEKLNLEWPDACILDIVIGDNVNAGIELAGELQQRDAKLPIIFVSVRDDIEARLGAVRAGGQAYLTKPVDIGHLVEAVDKVTGRIGNSSYRVLVVEDDESLARYYRTLLQDSGMVAEMVTDPLNVLKSVADFNPDVVLMDVYMPRCSGMELAQVIRQHGALGGIPIIFLSVEGDPDIQYAALQNGGDDFLTKPVDPQALVRAVTIRAQRARLAGTLMVRDGLTGLLNHGRIKEVLASEVARARRGNTSLVVAMLDLDHFKSINEHYGYKAGDRVIKSLSRLLLERLRGNDSAGRYGGEEFLLVLPECGLESARQRLDDIRTQFAQLTHGGESPELSFSATFNMGVAVFPPAINAEELLLRADASLHEAKLRSRYNAGQAPGQSQCHQ